MQNLIYYIIYQTKVSGQLLRQVLVHKITWKGNLESFEIILVQYKCNQSSSFADLFSKQNLCQNVQSGQYCY